MSSAPDQSQSQPTQPAALSPSLPPKAYSAPPAPGSSPLLGAGDSSLVHQIIQIRSGDERAAYMRQQFVPWVQKMEQIASESDDPAFQRDMYAQLLRFALATQSQEQSWEIAKLKVAQAAEARAARAQLPPGSSSRPTELHLHQHQHQHGEVPEVAKLSTADLAQLNQAFEQQIKAAQSNPRLLMKADEREAFERVADKAFIEQEKLKDQDAIDIYLQRNQDSYNFQDSQQSSSKENSNGS